MTYVLRVNYAPPNEVDPVSGYPVGLFVKDYNPDLISGKTGRVWLCMNAEDAMQFVSVDAAVSCYNLQNVNGDRPLTAWGMDVLTLDEVTE